MWSGRNAETCYGCLRGKNKKQTWASVFWEGPGQNTERYFKKIKLTPTTCKTTKPIKINKTNKNNTKENQLLCLITNTKFHLYQYLTEAPRDQPSTNNIIDTNKTQQNKTRTRQKNNKSASRPRWRDQCTLVWQESGGEAARKRGGVKQIVSLRVGTDGYYYTLCVLLY